ncbi:MAG TPA: choice-of-anchor X domain-containing protein [Nitrospira sp.]|nr:choice-of-anchor X domain-containing protein [Nitrospira sp.]
MITLRFHDRDAGATFSEVLVAMALTSMGVLGAMGAFLAADNSLGRDALATRALAMAESRLEAKRAASWNQLLLDDLDHDGLSDLTMHDDGTGGDRTAGDGIYSAIWEQQGVTVIWTVAFSHAGSLGSSGAVVIESRSVYHASTGEREVRLATLRANPAFIGPH